eukprot:3727399-Rhodomonas_salina.1
MPELEKAGSLRGEARIVSMSSASGFGAPGFNAEFFKKKGGNLGGQRASYERYHQTPSPRPGLNLNVPSGGTRASSQICSSPPHWTTSSEQRKALLKRSHVIRARSPLSVAPRGVCGTDMFVHAMSVMNPRRPSPPPHVAPASLTAISVRHNLESVCGPRSKRWPLHD